MLLKEKNMFHLVSIMTNKHYILNILSETKLLLVQDVQDQACTPLILNWEIIVHYILIKNAHT